MKKVLIVVSFLVMTAVYGVALPSVGEGDTAAVKTDSLPAAQADTLAADSVSEKPHRLNDDDYQRVADELGIDMATMKAVVEIEAGHTHIGMVEEGKALINFDLGVFKSLMRRNKKSIKPYLSYEAFKKVNVRKYGSYGKAQWARLESARTIDADLANQATFWGMFQIGGFNWKKCGCSTIDEFVERMCRSEQEQLELFAQFCIHMDLVKYLKKHDWNSFAYHYNGPRYRSLGYHTRLRKAYAKHK